MTRAALTQLLSSIQPADRTAMDAAERRQAELAKPPGSLGQLEEISIRLAGITGQVHNTIENTRVLVFAADNGVIAEGVSCAPKYVTLSQTINMTRHKSGMSSMAQAFGSSVVVTDVGIDGAVNCPAVRDCKIRCGTGNIARERAMTVDETLRAIEVGRTLVREAGLDGVQAIGIGEMGIGNTSTSAAVLAALTGADVERVAGRGGGLTDDGFQKKKAVLTAALALHHPPKDDPVEILSCVGGLDLAAMTGAFLGCAESHIPAVVDGYISIVAALCAVRLCPAVQDYLFLSHDSYEIGYRLAAEALHLTPCLLLGMRLGEGSGCPIMFQVLKAACAVMNNMATFAEAAIVDDYLDEIRQVDAFTVTKS